MNKPRRKYNSEYYIDFVGRRRKLSGGAMRDIQMSFAKGAKTADLAEAYGVSTSLIRCVCYSTPRDADLERMAEARHEQQEGK